MTVSEELEVILRAQYDGEYDTAREGRQLLSAIERAAIDPLESQRVRTIVDAVDAEMQAKNTADQAAALIVELENWRQAQKLADARALKLVHTAAYHYDGKVGREAESPATDAATEFRDFYLRDFQGVMRFLMRIGAPLDAAEDAAQEAFTEAWRRIRQGTWADIINQESWIRIVALNAYRRPLGSSQVLALPVPDPPEKAQPGDNHDERTLQTMVVVQALQRLPHNLQAVVAFKMDGFPHAVAAAYLGITEQQARNLLKKARKILAPQLEETTRARV